MAMTACAAKFFYQFDLLVSERTNLLAVDGDDTDQSIFLEHRNRKYSAITAKISAGHYKWIPLAVGWTLCDIVDLNRLLRKRRTA